MATRISRDPIYRRRRFSAETIELCVRWYITYRLSYRKTLSLGTFPDVPIARARSRHLAARQLLAAGVDPSLKRGELRRVGSGVG